MSMIPQQLLELLATPEVQEAVAKTKEAAQTKAVETPLKFEMVIAASGAKGGTLRNSHPELSQNLIYGKVVKCKGDFLTEDATGAHLVWTADDLIGATISLRMSQSQALRLEQAFNVLSPGLEGGRAAQLQVGSEDLLSVNINGVFSVVPLQMGELSAPTGEVPTAEEQRRLVLERKQENKTYDTARRERGRNRRSNRSADVPSQGDALGDALESNVASELEAL